MLRYVGVGKRRLGDYPMPAHPRLNWEFFAVTRGKLAPFVSSIASARPVSDRCWLFPPGAVHGWVGEQGKTCQVVVLHFSSVPKSIEEIATQHGVLEYGMGKNDRRTLAKITQVLQRHYWHPTAETDLLAERALIDLCLLMLRECQERERPRVTGGSYDRVVRAEEWLRAHLGERPSVSEVARHVGLSTSQLTRLFSRIRQETPQDCLNRFKIERAMELLGRSNAKLEKVAAECGFSSSSNLCRAFKAARGVSPTRWRNEIYIRHRTPPAGAEADYWQHGERIRAAS